MASALARASTSATSCGASASATAWRIALSSRPGGSTMKASPAASSSLALDLLDEARMRGGRPACRKPVMLRAPAPHIDDRPAMSRAQRSCLGDLGGDGFAVDIVFQMTVGVLNHAILANLRDALGACHQADDKGVAGHFELRRERHAWHQWHIGGLEAAIGEIDRGRRL